MEAKYQADLRRRERVAAYIPVGLTSKVGDWKADTAASTIDISLSGVCVRTRLALAPKQAVDVTIDGGFSRTIPGRVVWVRAHKSSHWKTAGIRFAA
jgi:hypothetical protein